MQRAGLCQLNLLFAAAWSTSRSSSIARTGMFAAQNQNPAGGNTGKNRNDPENVSDKFGISVAASSVRFANIHNHRFYMRPKLTRAPQATMTHPADS